jgi:hypothetical protein
MATLNFKASNTSQFSNNQVAVLLGKNNFQTIFGSIPLLANAVSVVDEDPIKRPNGNIKFTLVGFNQLHDYNFDKHVLAVNDKTFKAASGTIKGDDYVTVPVIDKTTDITQPDFPGSIGGTVTELTYNIVGSDIITNTVKIVNDHSGAKTLFLKLKDPPFYVTFQQLIDKDHLKGATTSTTSGWRPNTPKAGNVYIAGSTKTLILENNVSGFTGAKTLPLGVDVKSKNFIKFFVDGIQQEDDSYTFTLDSDTITFDFGSVAGAQRKTRTEATYYTVPAVEKGDNITLFTGNTYAVSNVSYDPAFATDYNARITANTIYRITLGESLKANVGGRTILNVTPNPSGFIGNVIQPANTFSFDYNASTFPGNWNLANNQIYSLASQLEFEQIFLGETTRKTIPNVPFGLNAVRARNKNSAGRLSKFTSRSLFVRQIPIRRVRNLEITESFFIDTVRGLSTRATISFDDITDQNVTDYEISYKISGTQLIGGVNQFTPIASFNTVKVDRLGVGSDGRIRYTIQNVTRLTGTNVTLLVRVTPLNRQLRGIPAEVSQIIIGKTEPPSNVSGFIVGTN